MAVLWDSAATTMILLENHGVLQPITVIYSVPLLNIHVRVRTHPYHEPCASKYTKKTEGYTWPFADVVHKAWKNSQIEINRGIESCEARYFRKLNRKVIPAMPCNTNTKTTTDTQYIVTHRPRSAHQPAYNAMVARLLTMKEVNGNPKAQQAILEEGEKLVKQGVWDLTSVREKRDVIRDATKNNKKVHFARIFPMF